MAFLSPMLLISALAFAAPGNSPQITQANTQSIRNEVRAAIAEQEISSVRTLTPILSAVANGVAVLAAVVGLAFGGILIFILRQLRDLQNERKLNEHALRKVAEHSQHIENILKQVELMKGEIRDAALAARQKVVSDEEYTSFIKNVMAETPSVAMVNILKDLIWRENISLDELKPTILDKDLQRSILERYRAVFDKSSAASLLQGAAAMNRRDLLRWAYAIKVKGKTFEDLTKERHQLEKVGKGLVGLAAHWREITAEKK